MSRFRHSRRRFLRGALQGGGLVTVGLPALELLAPRRAHAGGDLFPRRFGLFFWGNGNRPDQWTPIGDGDGDDWALSEELAPLAAVKEKLTVVSGMSTKVENISPHWSGAAGLLTGRQVDGDDDDWTVHNATLDQRIAAEVGDFTLYRSLEIGIGSSEIFSYSGPNAPLPGETDPHTFYQRLFGDTFREPGEKGIVDPALGYRRSVLDAVMGDIGRLQSELGAADRARLEQHLDGVRELELRLARLEEDPPDYESCTRPGVPKSDYPDLNGRPQLSARSRVMADMLAMALACDQSRVFHLHFSPPLYRGLFAGVSDDHHNLTHNEGGDQPEVHAITVQVIEELAYLLSALDAVPEGGETLLDHTLVMATSEVSEGRTHSLNEIPLLFAGGDAFKRNHHYRSYTQENVSRAVLSVLRAMDIPAASYGEEDAQATDSLSAIEV
jgi:hypothetical protein